MKNKILLFDLDGTIYQTHKYGVYDQLKDNIFKFIANEYSLTHEQAKEKSRIFQDEYGTTARGLKLERNISPQTFLKTVYDLDFSQVSHDDTLKEQLSKIPNRKIIFTNATKDYAQNLLHRMGILEFFDDIIDIEDTNFVSKPNIEAYSCLKNINNEILLQNAVLIDDRWQNLETAKDLGMHTILCNHSIHSEHDSFHNIYDILNHITEEVSND